MNLPEKAEKIRSIALYFLEKASGALYWVSFVFETINFVGLGGKTGLFQNP
jgi:hypothetical protein